jgi:hypothetical protein
MHFFRDAGGFAPAQQHVAFAVGQIDMRARSLGGEQHDPAAFLLPPVLERVERNMIHDAHVVEIVEPGTAKRFFGRGEGGGTDDMDRNAETGAEPENRAGVLRDVGLIEGDDHDRLAACGKSRRGLCSFDELCKPETALPHMRTLDNKGQRCN